MPKMGISSFQICSARPAYRRSGLFAAPQVFEILLARRHRIEPRVARIGVHGLLAHVGKPRHFGDGRPALGYQFQG